MPTSCDALRDGLGSPVSDLPRVAGLMPHVAGVTGRLGAGLPPAAAASALVAAVTGRLGDSLFPVLVRHSWGIWPHNEVLTEPELPSVAAAAAPVAAVCGRHSSVASCGGRLAVAAAWRWLWRAPESQWLPQCG